MSSSVFPLIMDQKNTKAKIKYKVLKHHHWEGKIKKEEKNEKDV